MMIMIKIKKVRKVKLPRKKHKTHQKIAVEDESDKDSNERVESEVIENIPTTSNDNATNKGFQPITNKSDD